MVLEALLASVFGKGKPVTLVACLFAPNSLAPAFPVFLNPPELLNPPAITVADFTPITQLFKLLNQPLHPGRQCVFLHQKVPPRDPRTTTQYVKRFQKGAVAPSDSVRFRARFWAAEGRSPTAKPKSLF